MKGQTEKLTDAQLSKKLGSCQKAESIGMLLGILCVVSGCILMFVKRDIILICVLVFVGVALFLLVAKPAQTKKKALLQQQLGGYFRAELTRMFGVKPAAPALPIDRAYLKAAKLSAVDFTECTVTDFHEGECAGLRPTMTLKSVVEFVKDLLPGESVSYGRTYTANTPRKVATVCVGYADGYPRALSGSNGNPNAGVMSIRGKPAPIIGRVCMDQTLVDVTDIPDVKMNDEVTVFGPENAAIGADTADSIAAKTGTINYEIICGISRRVPRVYLRDGAPVRIWNDLEET